MAPPANRLNYWLETAAENGATLALIDTASHTETAALAAARAASLVIIPCKPSLLDLEAIKIKNTKKLFSCDVSFVSDYKLSARFINSETI